MYIRLESTGIFLIFSEFDEEINSSFFIITRYVIIYLIIIALSSFYY